MTLEPGRTLGPYEIVAPLGAGGMGEVWRARDTRLDRGVAIKVLPEALARSEPFRERFEREARAVSQLNHPHICVLHDVGEEDGHPFLVMELLEGESLADRLARGPLPLHEVLRFGSQIAQALGAAHRAGITHRDLKPGNVMLTKSGAKLLDFGLAKAGPEAPAVLSGLSALATEAKPLTEKGTILGTFQYMAPEQLEGLEADARTDIFALGALLYEMATGKRAFAGASRTSLIAAIVSSQPVPVSSLVPATPPALDQVIRRCLEKDPEDRWQSAQDVAGQLQWISEAGSQAGVAAPVTLRRKTRERLAWGVAAIALLAAGAVVSVLARREPPRVVRSSLLPPEGARYAASVGAPALSPDGTRLVFCAGPEQRLWVRSLNALTAVPLPGTEGAMHPFWSPDGQRIGFFSNGKLRRVDASGGPSQALCGAPNPRGGTWGPDGTILFTPSNRDVLYRVPANGGTPVAVTSLDQSRGENSHRLPQFLPDGKRFIFLATSERSTDAPSWIRSASLDSGESRPVVATDSSARYASPGYLLFLRDRTLVAQPFDRATLALSGEAVPLAENMAPSGRFETIVSASDTGLLSLLPGAVLAESRLVWLDRSGRELGTVGKPAAYEGPALSHDQTRVAVGILDPQSLSGDIWVQDLARGTSTRLTFDPAHDYRARWSPDDSRVYFASNRSGSGDIYAKAASGIGAAERVYGSEDQKIPWSLSADGRSLWFFIRSTTGSDISRLDLGSSRAEGFLETPFDESHPAVSPDGHWLAYASNESSRSEVFVRSLLAAGGRWQISIDGGSVPTWTRKGREMVFRGGDGQLMAVDVTLEPTFTAGTPQALFDPREAEGPGTQFDVTSDGQRFLVNQPAERPAVEPLTLVQNWTRELQR